MDVACFNFYERASVVGLLLGIQKLREANTNKSGWNCQINCVETGKFLGCQINPEIKLRIIQEVTSESASTERETDTFFGKS